MLYMSQGFCCRFKLMFALVAVLLALASCGGTRSPEKVVAVSIPPQKYILEQIVGDKAVVKSLLNSGANPENYDPMISQLMDLEKSSVYFTVGSLGFEDAILSKIKDNNPDLTIVNSMEGVTMLTGTHGDCGNHSDHGHDEAVDPHTWSSVKNVRAMAANMLAAMQRVDPDNKEYYERRFMMLDHRLDSLDRAIADQLTDVCGNAFVVWHPSLSYFAADYGLEQIVVGRENKEATANKLKSQIDEARRHGAKVFFFQKEFDSRQAKAINQQLGTEIVMINPMNGDWEDEITGMVKALTDGK